MRKLKAMKSVLLAVAGAAAMAWPGASAFGQSPVIASFGSNGEMVCTNLLAGSTASVEWASSVLGPWTNSWDALAAVTADSNGTIRVSVPMFYRVRGVPAPAGMVLIPAGSFVMGDTFAEGDSAELPLHTNQLSAFYMDRYAVTKALWDEVLGWANTNGYDLGTIGSGKATNHPVHSVNWYDAVKWCNARSEKEGRMPAYYTGAAQTTVYRTGQTNVQNEWVKWTGGYRLPTEAEWEKAARGGANGLRFPWGHTISHSNANYYSDSSYAYDLSPTRGYHPSFQAGGYPYANPVDYFAPNGYGLYGMAGNTSQWCWDWYSSSYYTVAPPTDPRGPSGVMGYRVLRGGGWSGDAVLARCAARGDNRPVSAGSHVGLRCVRGL